MTQPTPTWADDIQALFADPYWVAAEERKAVAGTWRGCMSAYFVHLDEFESVRKWGETIYHHLRSQSMPATSDHSQMFPPDALETLRLWINQGSRCESSDPFDRAERIPKFEEDPVTLRKRRDLRSLSEHELNVYRAKLDDVMRVSDASPDSPWQKLAYIHTNWCLHYQEAFVFWHRAYLCYFEELIDHAVPYWNWMAEHASVDGDPDAGIPQAFKDEEYRHPETGELRPNPLRFAAAKDGVSKVCQSGPVKGINCKWVQRDPVLMSSGEEHRKARAKRIKMTKIFQEQVANALQWSVFSTPQGTHGPWANIPSFSPPQPDHLYPHRTDFDGLYEQPHDNYHGWIGADMADNAYTAFDPIFWSYHANIDRMYEVWRARHPRAIYTAGFPIQPFLGPDAKAVEFSDKRKWRYVTIGDMAQDARRIGFTYESPVSADLVAPEVASEFPPARYKETAKDRLWVVFKDVRCTYDSYLIDVFLEESEPTASAVDPENHHYVGRFSRIGMGMVDENNRCVKTGVTRVLDATKNVALLGIPVGSAPTVSILVTEIESGRALDREEWLQLPGFEPVLHWGGRWPIGMELGDPSEKAADGGPTSGGCCAT